jgi:hypothetical protein
VPTTTTTVTGFLSMSESRDCVARDGFAVTPATANTPANPANSRKLRKSMRECLHTGSVALRNVRLFSIVDVGEQ